jgi:hypothetical protein
MSDLENSYALPLFALIDRAKVDLDQPIPDELAEHLAAYLSGSFGIQSLTANAVAAADQIFLVLHGVPQDSLPALFSLVDVQKTELYRFERPEPEQIRLTPLRLKVG